jgi:hypothetical protein
MESFMRQNLARMTWTDDEADRLLGELQHTLANLADVEMRREIEHEQIEAWSVPTADKARLSEESERRYQLDREPYLRRLDVLQRQARLQILDDL